MNLLFIATSIAFFVWIIRNSLFWVYLWQVKEYRFDRIYVYFKETNTGRGIIFSYFSAIKWAVFFFFLLVSVNNDFLLSYRLFIFFIFAIEAVLTFKEFLSHRLRRPVITIKSVLILLLTLFFISLLFSLPLTEQFLWFLLLDRFVFLFVVLFVLIFRLPTEFYSDMQAERAVKKIQSRKDLLVIGITGSYGKSTTKEYVAQILAQKYTVLKTKGTNNTLIGVVKTVISDLRRDTEILVVEMGAYKKGEIAKICSVVNPKIGIITGISNQHLSLFGSQKNILEAKYELIDSLSRNGLAVFNGNSENAFNLYKKTKKKKILYQVVNKTEKKLTNDIWAYDVSVRKDGIYFKVALDGKVFKLHASVIGKQNIENILPGIYIAYKLGIKPKEIEKAVGSLTSLQKTMVRHKVKNGLTLIDDTFNASSASVVSAIFYISLYKGIKTMILSPMIELGEDSSKEHYKAGLEIGKVCDFLYLTNKNYSEDIVRGVKDSGGKCMARIGNLKEITDFVKECINKDAALDDIILFEGKEAGFILDRIL